MAARFERLLDLYRRPDGERWGGQDLEDATGGFVTRSYVSTLKKGNIGSPGFDKLRAIARAMGFPPEMWFDDSLGTRMHQVVGGEGDVTVGERLEYLFATIVNERTGSPYAPADIAKMSFGGITEEEIVGIRSGEIVRPTLDQVLALSEAFGVDPSYFARRGQKQDGTQAALAQEEAASIVRKTMALSVGDRRVVLDLLDHLGRREKAG